MEIDTAARHRASMLIVVVNKGSWAIEVRDQQDTHGKVVGMRLQFVLASQDRALEDDCASDRAAFRYYRATA